MTDFIAFLTPLFFIWMSGGAFGASCILTAVARSWRELSPGYSHRGYRLATAGFFLSMAAATIALLTAPA